MKILGIERLHAAHRVLDDAGPVPAERVLFIAASEVWSAMFDLHTWPTGLRARAVSLQTSLFRYGPIRMTLEQMVAIERLQLHRELLAFVEHAERLHDECTAGLHDDCPRTSAGR